MSGEVNSLEMLPRTNAVRRVQVVEEPAEVFVFGPVQLESLLPLRPSAAPTHSRDWKTLRSGEAVEALSYLLLWLCACAGIGLCLW